MNRNDTYCGTVVTVKDTASITDVSSKKRLFQKVASLALAALLEEAVLLPKPGLVDPVSAGAHTDMTIDTFMKSAAVLPFGFVDFLCIGSKTQGQPISVIRRTLRQAGIVLERDMFAATGGCNTHKGAVFIFAYLLAAAGRLLPRIVTPAILFAEVRQLAAGLFAEDMQGLADKQNLTHGEQMYKTYGCRGIRGEVENGLPSVEQNLAYYVSMAYLPPRDTALYTLLRIMSHNDDTNVLFRAGKQELEALQQQCADIISACPTPRDLSAAVEKLDTFCISRNISAGGSADILAAVLFCKNMQQEGMLLPEKASSKNLT